MRTLLNYQLARNQHLPHWAALRREAGELTGALATRERPFVADLLQLTAWIDYVEMLLENQRVVRYLAKCHPDIMQRLKSVIRSNGQRADSAGLM